MEFLIHSAGMIFAVILLLTGCGLIITPNGPNSTGFILIVVAAIIEGILVRRRRFKRMVRAVRDGNIQAAEFNRRKSHDHE